MLIKQLACEQFAGLVDRKIAFDPGLNLVIGANESGKSTLIDLIYHLLFKDVKLNAKSDMAFMDRYFPKKLSGPQGNVVDGSLVFETAAGTYKLEKEWEQGAGSCRLTLPDGTRIKGTEQVQKVLGEELTYRAGVFGEIVFASQKREQMALESIMKSLKNRTDAAQTREDLASTLTRTVLETGGVSLEKLEKGIQGKQEELIGRWDLAADAPEGGAKRASYKNAWNNKTGAIVRAYYELDEVRSRQQEAEKAERAVEEEKAILQELQAKKAGQEAERNQFQKFRGQIDQRTLLNGKAEDLENQMEERAEVLAAWPGLGHKIEAVQALAARQRQARLKALYEKAAPLHRQWLDKQAALQGQKPVAAEDLTTLRGMEREKQKEEARLTGMKLLARVKKLGKAEIAIKSLASGAALHPEGETLEIREAVEIQIPGVMEMQLAPQGVDVEAVKTRLAACETEISRICGAYKVRDLAELQALADAHETARQEAVHAQISQERTLGQYSWDALEEARAEFLPETETEEAIQGQLAALCEGKSPEAFIGGLETRLLDFQNKYESPEALRKTMDKLAKDRETARKKLEALDAIPEAYREIEDAEAFDAELEAGIQALEEDIKAHDEALRSAERSLGDTSAEEYAEELRDKELALAALKKEYSHWAHIQKVFDGLKAESGDKPIQGIEESFRKYLALLSDGGLRLEAMAGNLAVQLASGPYALTYDILSEGTRETLSLAFRLAMLEYLYPEGGGLAVFDDPFTDMDAKRRDQACRLIQKFAEHNQVIFVTCEEQYTQTLAGKVNRIAR